jgi:transcriptional regulator with XRE-family HTH domain
MELLTRFGAGLQLARKCRGLTQEDFSVASSRTYLSSLERGKKSPTITKLEELASVLNLHPLSLLALAYAPDSDQERRDFFALVAAELQLIQPAQNVLPPLASPDAD